MHAVFGWRCLDLGRQNHEGVVSVERQVEDQGNQRQDRKRQAADGDPLGFYVAGGRKQITFENGFC